MSNKIPTIGSRIQVFRGHAKKTSGGLTKSDLMMNKHGRVVSKSKHFTAKKEKRLLKYGYGTQKGKFGYVKINSKSRKSHSKKMKGGMSPLSPLDLSENTNFVGGSGISTLYSPGSAAWAGDTIGGSSMTDYGDNSTDVQIRAGMTGGRNRSRSRSYGRSKALALGRSRGMAFKSRSARFAMRGGTGNRSVGNIGSDALQLRAGNA